MDNGDSIILEEEIDPTYEPSRDEVLEYAKFLGMNLAEDEDLLWIAREGLKVRALLVCHAQIIVASREMLCTA